MAQDDIDRLFEAPPDQFVAERDRLSAALRERGESDLASEVKKLRKPTLPAWALNQLVRRQRREVDELLQAGQELREVQRRADPQALRQAGHWRRELMARLIEAASGIAAEQGAVTDGVRRAMEATLEAASADPRAGEELQSGRLTRPLEGARGFEALGGLAVVPGGRSKSDEAAEARAQEDRRKRALEDARRRLAEAEDEVRRAELRARTLAAEAKKIAERAREAEDQVRGRKADRTEAKRGLQKAERALKRA
ncbi:MAG TPA: hypothetical protein VE962_06365 [Actinomycetota bacterium]|nr:hypothetical protein [Actinomycetota bacterium]